MTNSVATPVTGPLGLLGGTFDPIHHGHLRLAEEMATALNLAEVRIMPAGVPPHRAAPLAEATQRRAMVQLAIGANPRFSLDASELERPGPGYMVDTLKTMRDRLGDSRAIVLILGADAFSGLTTWRHWPRLFELCHFAIALRPGYADWERNLPDDLAGMYRERYSDDAQVLTESLSGRIVQRAITQLDISATRIRTDISAGRSPRYLLPDAVLDYIDQQRLYL